MRGLLGGIMKLSFIFFNNFREFCDLHADSPEFISNSPCIVRSRLMQNPLVELSPQVLLSFAVLQVDSLLVGSVHMVKGLEGVSELLRYLIVLP